MILKRFPGILRHFKEFYGILRGFKCRLRILRNLKRFKKYSLEF